MSFIDKYYAIFNNNVGEHSVTISRAEFANLLGVFSKQEQQFEQLKAEDESLKKTLKNFLNCPRWCDESTVPQVVKSGLENQDKYAQQIVYNLSVSLSRILEAEQVLQKINEVENES